MSITENTRIELKRELTKKFENEAIAFLNYHEGGVIYIGIDDDGIVHGVDDPDGEMLKIKDRLKNNISPSIMGLFDVMSEKHEGKDVIKIIFASGSEKPYYLKDRRMTERGAFIRVGTAIEPMPTRMIEDLFAKRVRNSLRRIQSPRQDLTFGQLKIYYEAAGKTLNDQFAATLELLTDEGKYNYVAYLLADSNGVSIKEARYDGLTRVDLIENNEYGYYCLVKATQQLLDKVELENKTYTRITGKAQREERRLWNGRALREAVINSIVHNDYTTGASPKVEFFDDRIEITSIGGLVQGMTKEEFFSGLSKPRNQELMRVFRDLDIVEHLGSGIPRILEAYGKECFIFSDNFLRMVFPAAEQLAGYSDVSLLLPRQE
ncbi:MAG: putative DNA binding domain-containing protein [Culturomica sp.]|jgi:predicted HTH transcriptional regulator|nr:putative DNA binding domain-containing protein [Culturomica sp.]